MKDYFILQWVMTNRKIKEAGINPFLGYFLATLLFILVTQLMFYKTDFAKYLVATFSLLIQFKLSDKNRTDFLLSTLGDNRKRKIRILENLMISIPFVAVLLYEMAFLEASILLVASMVLATISFHTNFSISIPTPFSKRPFEYAIGFRKTFFLFPLTYTLAIIAINVNNLNLGLFAMALTLLVPLSYYQKPEQDFIVWIHAQSVQKFLKLKLLIATKNATLLSSPVLLGLVIFHPTALVIILAILLIGILLLWLIVLAKYSAFPKEINFSEGLLIATVLFLPPLILVMIPYFYMKSVSNLKLLLND